MEFSIGQTASVIKVMTAEDVNAFAALSGDYNVLHMDSGRCNPFGAPICHGFLVGGLISRVIGMELPGPGSVYLSQSMKFLKPVYVGDQVTVQVEITDIRPEKEIYILHTTVYNQKDELVLDGEAVVKRF